MLERDTHHAVGSRTLFGRRAGIASPARSTKLPSAAPARYFKGNLHTHTLNSDGDSTPDDVVRWYRERDYQFLTLTDHNYLTSVDGLNAVHGADDKFIVMKGEEVTDRFGDKPVHLNGFAPTSFIKPPGGNFGAGHGAEDDRCHSRRRAPCRASIIPTMAGRSRRRIAEAAANTPV